MMTPLHTKQIRQTVLHCGRWNGSGTHPEEPVFRAAAGQAAAWLLVLAWCALPARAPAESSIDWAEVHIQTVRGIDQLYNLEMDSALQTFERVSAMAPADPRGSFFGSMVWFWRFTMTHAEDDYEAFLARSENAVEVCERLLDRNPSDVKTLFYLGGLKGYRGLAHNMDGSMIRAAREGTQGYWYLEQAVRRDSSLYDARMGFGLFKYLVGKVPRSLRWLLDLLGFEGDIEGGLKLLREAAVHGVYTKSEAAFFLSGFLFSEGRHDEAFEYLAGLIARYPENSVFQVMAAAGHLRLDRPDEALVAAERALEINGRKKVKYGEDIVYATLGAIAFARNDFPRARENYALFVRTAPERSRIWNRNLYRLGVSCEIGGDRAAALGAYRKLRTPTDEQDPWDAPYYRRGRELLRTPLTPAGAKLIMADNCRSLSDSAGEQQFFREALRLSEGNPDLEAQARYGILQFTLDEGLYAVAVLAADTILSLPTRNDTWIIPHTLYVRGKALAGLGDNRGARKALEEALRHDGYDYQRRLEGRIERELETLEKQP